MPEVITFGESMLRLSVEDGNALERASSLRLEVAGSESNVAIGLSRMGISTGWISRLVDNPLGRRIVYDIQANGVDVSRVLWAAEGRVGTYYLEPGRAPRAARVIYDRTNSAITGIDPTEVDWAYAQQARLIHLTGITPALGSACRSLVEQAIKRAREAGQLISFDVNYRGKLWSPTAAKTCLDTLLPGLNIVLCSRRDAAQVFGITAETASGVAQGLVERYEVSLAVVTDGERGAAAYDGAPYQQPAFPSQIIDRIGAGDAFAVGFLTGYLEDGTAKGLAYGTALAALKLTYYGDISWSRRADVEALIAQGSSDAGQVMR